jgi:hypothetical protein
MLCTHFQQQLIHPDPEKSVTDFHFRQQLTQISREKYYRFLIPEDVITDPVPDPDPEESITDVYFKRA